MSWVVKQRRFEATNAEAQAFCPKGPGVTGVLDQDPLDSAGRFLLANDNKSRILGLSSRYRLPYEWSRSDLHAKAASRQIALWPPPVWDQLVCEMAFVASPPGMCDI
jgi:hypothetical protein